MSEAKRKDLLEIILDENDHSPIEIPAADGRIFSFEQIFYAQLDGEIYVMLKPIDKIEGMNENEAAIFLLDVDDEGWTVPRIELNPEIQQAVFAKYLECIKNQNG